MAETDRGIYYPSEAEKGEENADILAQMKLIAESVDEVVGEIGDDYNDKFAGLKSIVVASNAGAHNAIYRGKDITNLFYNGTLSTQIAAGTFDDIFIGDYIIGQNSNRKYLVADINYRLHTGDINCTTPHVLMITEKLVECAQMNSSNTTTGAYLGSKMYNTNLTTTKNIVINDFGAEHILTHRTWLPNAVTNGYESNGEWKYSTIELMNELMVYGSNIFHNAVHGTNIPIGNVTIDNSQLSLFKHNHSSILGFTDSNSRECWWLRDVASSSFFSIVDIYGNAATNRPTESFGVRPAFLIY